MIDLVPTTQALRQLLALPSMIRLFSAALKQDAALGVISAVLEKNLKDELQSHTGNEPDRPYPSGYVHTIDSIHTYLHPLGAMTVIEGAAGFLQGGTKAHTITGKNGGLMTFKTADSRWFRRRSVNHPGYAGDAFATRAIEKTLADEAVMGQFTARIVGEAYASVFVRALGAP